MVKMILRRALPLLAALLLSAVLMREGNGRAEEIGGYLPGDTVTFGHYPQTAAGNDETPIEWVVLDVRENRALLLSRYGLDAQAYHAIPKKAPSDRLTWEKCTLRTWLNRRFLISAFSVDEQKAILTTEVDNSRDREYLDMDGGAGTMDRVFLLSFAETAEYLMRDGIGEAAAAPTAFAIKNGAWANGADTMEEGRTAGPWWLRSPADTEDRAAAVFSGRTVTGAYAGSNVVMVRPALWIELEKAEEAGLRASGHAQNRETSAHKAGERLTIGHYPQTAAGNDETPIEWEILAVNGDRALLLSRYGLDAKQYHTAREKVTWEKCALRAWLNGGFLHRAFSEEERALIPLTVIDNGRSQGYEYGGNDTRDRVFLLSYAEAALYLNADGSGSRQARAAPTPYAVRKGAWTSADCRTEDNAAAGWWWLRTSVETFAGYVTGSGAVEICPVSFDILTVRPAMWIDLILFSG